MSYHILSNSPYYRGERRERDTWGHMHQQEPNHEKDLIHLVLQPLSAAGNEIVYS